MTNHFSVYHVAEGEAYLSKTKTLISWKPSFWMQNGTGFKRFLASKIIFQLFCHNSLRFLL